MGILARNSITLFHVREVETVTWFYKLQASTATPPAKPTTLIPSGWITTEPGYEEGSTNSLYITQRTVFSDGVFEYSDVSLSSSYEAAKAAYNKAQAAIDAASPIATKTFTGVIGTANSVANAVLYFAKIHPTSYSVTWRVQLEIQILAPETHTQSVSIQFGGYGSTFNSYDAYTILNSAVGMYALYLYRATQAGIETNKKGHAIGFSLYSSTNPTGAAYARTIKVDVISVENCTFEFLDSAVKYASMDGTGATNYSDYTAMNVNVAGQNATNNSDTKNQLQSMTAKMESAVVAASLVVGTSAGYKQLNSGTPWDITYPIMYCSKAVAAGATNANVFYAINFTVTTTQAMILTPHEPVYAKGTLNGTTFTPISTAPLTQDIPTTEDGYAYIFIGRAYSTTHISLSTEHPIYVYHNGKFCTTAEAAASDAANAMTSANSKNKVFHQSSAPLASVGLQQGDTWFDTDDGYKMYTWDGTQWVEEQFGEAAIQDLAITNAKIANGTIQNAKIVSLDGGKITAGSINARQLNARAVTADKMAIGEFTNFATVNPFIPGTMCSLSNMETAVASDGGETAYSKSDPEQQYLSLNTVYIPNSFKKGTQFYFEITARTSENAGNVSLKAGGYRATYGYQTGSSTVAIPLTTSYTLVTGTITLDTDDFDTVPYILFYIIDNRGTSGSGREQIYIKSAKIFRKTEGDLIVDGSITADKIAAEAVSADKIYGGTLTLGGANNGRGQLLLVDENGDVLAQLTNVGLTGVRRLQTALGSQQVITITDGTISKDEDGQSADAFIRTMPRGLQSIDENGNYRAQFLQALFSITNSGSATSKYGWYAIPSIFTHNLYTDAGEAMANAIETVTNWDTAYNPAKRIRFLYGYNATNAPAATAHFIGIEMSFSATHRFQLVVRTNATSSNPVYIRHCNNNSWLGWGQITAAAPS